MSPPRTSVGALALSALLALPGCGKKDPASGVKDLGPLRLSPNRARWYKEKGGEDPAAKGAESPPGPAAPAGGKAP